MNNHTVMIGIPCIKTGGTEIQTLRLAEALVAGGYRCITVCYFEYNYPTVQQFKDAGCEVVCLSAYGKRPESRRDTYKFLKTGLKRVVQKYNPDIAHIQYMAPGAMPIIVLRRLGVKTILATTHTNADIYSSLKLIHFLQRHILRAFTCVTETAERGFFGSSNLFDKEYKLDKHNHFTVPDCLAPNTEFGRSQQQGKPFVIGFVAQLKAIKGADYVMPAFAKVLELHTDCRLMIVGDGDMRELMERQMHELNIPKESVIWHGYVEHRKLQNLYGSMSVVWVPSRSEGFGLSAIEAMAHGCAIVASNTGGLTEIVHDGADGMLIKTGDINELASKTVSLINDTQLYKSISDKAVENARHYSFETYKERILALYSVISES